MWRRFYGWLTRDPDDGTDAGLNAVRRFVILGTAAAILVGGAVGLVRLLGDDDGQETLPVVPSTSDAPSTTPAPPGDDTPESTTTIDLELETDPTTTSSSTSSTTTSTTTTAPVVETTAAPASSGPTTTVDPELAGIPAISVGDPVADVVDVGTNQIDVYTLALEEGRTYRFDLNAENYIQRLWLYYPDTRPVDITNGEVTSADRAMDMGVTTRGEGVERYTPAASGTYILVVEANDPGQTYTLTITDLS